MDQKFADWIVRGVAWAVLLTLALPASAQTVYNKFSDPVGRYSQEGGRTVFRDNAGNPRGYWQPEGGYIVHRDNAGNLIDKVKP